MEYRIDGYKIGGLWLLKLVDVDKFKYERTAKTGER